MLYNFIISLIAVTYAVSDRPVTTMPSLSGRERTYINNLSDNQGSIPAWLIAQLLDVADRFNRIPDKTLLSVPEVRLNDILSNSDRFRAQIVSFRGFVAEVVPVGSELQLSPGDRCWSVIILDSDYRRPIQCFTTVEPLKFRKTFVVKVVGYFLANRIDRSKSWVFSESLIIPVIIGTIIPVGGEKEGEGIFSEKKFLLLLSTIIIVLSISYFVLRMYTRKAYRKRDSLSVLKKGKMHEEGPSEPGG